MRFSVESAHCSVCARRVKRFLFSAVSLFCLLISFGVLSAASPARKALRTVVDLDIGETRKVELSDGSAATVKVLEIKYTRDSLRSAIRTCRVTVAVDGKTIELEAANYNLPTVAGNLLLDCPITGGYYENTSGNFWGLEKDARLRLWPAGSPYIAPGTFVYPLRQRWFASLTQMSNEPAYVDGGETSGQTSIYYHAGLDIAGAERLDEVVSATDGLVVVSGRDSIMVSADTPRLRVIPDAVYILDERGWYINYLHFAEIDPAIKPGTRVKAGQKLGLLGRVGTSGGYNHLHFEIFSKQPSGKWGTEEGYAYLWQSYLEQYKPALIAVARPHQVARPGQTVTLDGGKSKCFSDGGITSFQWTFSDGSSATGPLQQRVYSSPGSYCERLKIEDAAGNRAYDFALVQVIEKVIPPKVVPILHAAFYPTFGIEAGDPVIFQVRSFNSLEGRESWDFGDGSPPVETESLEGYDYHLKDFGHPGLGYRAMEQHPGGYGWTAHRFAEPGHYIVTVTRTGHDGYPAATRLYVHVLPRAAK